MSEKSVLLKMVLVQTLSLNLKPVVVLRLKQIIRSMTCGLLWRVFTMLSVCLKAASMSRLDLTKMCLVAVTSNSVLTENDIQWLIQLASYI